MRKTLAFLTTLCCLVIAVPAGAQERRVFHVDGWKWQNNESTGTLYFHCEDKSFCSKDATVSYKAVGGGTMTLDQFRAYQDQNVKALIAQLPSSNPKLIEARPYKNDAVPAYIAVRSVVLDKKPVFSVNAFFDGPQNNVSMISSAPTREEAERNFETFVSLAILVAKGKSK
jgi:hypothetical protein